VNPFRAALSAVRFNVNQKGKVMIRKNPIIAFVGLVCFVALVSSNYYPLAAPKPHPKVSAQSYHDTWRKLWEDHITWTRVVIIGILDSLPGVTNYEARLLQNPGDMAAQLKPCYGATVATEFSDLVTDHLAIAVELLEAAKAGNTAAFNDAKTRWYQNADDIATLMAAINPKNWPFNDTSAMWKAHLDATLDEAVKHATGDYTGEVAAYDLVHTLALEMADMFSSGIVAQFHGQFTGNIK
jgi:hypothetical protein